MLVDPVESSADHRLRVIAELVIDGNRRIAGELGALASRRLVEPQVLGVHLVVRQVLERTQQYAAPRVERRAAGDVRMADDEVDDGANLRFRRRIRSRTLLLEFLPPARREIAVEIESVPGSLDLQRMAVEAVVAAFGNDAVISAPRFNRIAAHHQARLLRMRLPQSVRILDAHLQDAAIAVDVLDRQSLVGLLVERIGACAGAYPLRVIGQRPLGAIGVDARADVERASVERARHVGVAAVLRDERVQEIERRGRRGDFRRMDVAVNPERRLVARGPGCRIRDRHRPDVTPFVAFADGFDRHETGMLPCERVQQFGELGVAVEAIEGNSQHGTRGRIRRVFRGVMRERCACRQPLHLTSSDAPIR